MNNYSFVQIKPNGSFLTIIDAKNTPRYMCFSNKMDAFHCISYVSKFRADHGSFPIIDLSRPGEKFEIKAKSLGTKRTPSSIAKYFKVTSYDENDIDEEENDGEEEENDDDNRKREEQLLRDFKHLESQHDYATIKNRIISGTSWDWLIEINPNEVIEPTNNEGGFW